MFGIQLDTVKKIELGFCLVVLGLAGYFFFAGSRSAADSTVSAWTTYFPIGENGRVAGPNNPEDGSKSYQITYFVNVDGELHFTEYPKRGDGNRAEIAFKFNSKKKTYECFPTPMQIVQGYKDETRRALSMAAVDQIFNNNRWRLFSQLDLDKATTEALSKSYGALLEAVNLYDADVPRGLIEKDLYNKVMAALEEFRNSGPDDIKDNPKKQQAAKKVMQLGLDFYKKMQDDKLEKVSNWVDDTMTKLNDDQKKKAVDQANQYTQRIEGAATRPGRGGGGFQGGFPGRNGGGAGGTRGNRGGGAGNGGGAGGA